MSEKPGMSKIKLGPTGEHLAETVERLRTSAHLSYAELSRLLESNGHRIPPLGLRRIEAQARKVDADEITALASALHVSPLVLLFPATDSTDDETPVTGVPHISQLHLWSWGLGEVGITPFEPARREFPSWLDVLERARQSGADSQRARIAELERLCRQHLPVDVLKEHHLPFESDGNDD